MAEWNWDWTKNLPPLATIFPQLGTPSVSPIVEGGMSFPTPPAELVRPYTPPKMNPPVGPGLASNITAPGQTGVKFPSGVPLGDFTNPAPTQPAETEAEAKARILKAYLENKDFMGGLAAIAKGVGGGGKAPISHAMRMEGIRGMNTRPDLTGSGGPLMAQALAKMAGEEWDLTAPRKRKGGVQSRYDIINKRQSSVRDLLSQLE